MPSPEFDALLPVLTNNILQQATSVAEMRAGMELLTQAFPAPPDLACTPVDAGGVPAEWVAAPGADGGRVVFYLHGGGYVIGSPRTHREFAGRLSRAAAARVLLADYRLAPEHPHPAAVKDAVSAYCWLLNGGTDPKRTVIAGDSAGGGLTAATLVALRDRGLPLPAAGVCLSPWTDMEAAGESMRTKAAVDPLLQRQTLLDFAAHYLAGQDPRLPLASPIHADLRGLPPLLIHVGSAEVLLDDATRLAERARAAGVEVTLEVWDDMIHVWHVFGSILPEGQAATVRVADFVRAHT
jgi:acetyl esterase/lipase